MDIWKGELLRGQANRMKPLGDPAKYESPSKENLYDDLGEPEEIPAHVKVGLLWVNLTERFTSAFGSWRQGRWLSQLAHVLRTVGITKDLMLILSPSRTWDAIVKARYGWVYSTFLYFMPLFGAWAFMDGWGLYRLGQQQMAKGMVINRFAMDRVLAFEFFQVSLIFLLVSISAFCISEFGNACHRRIRFKQGLLLLIHSTGPLLVIQFFDTFPELNVWIIWMIGLGLSLGALYHGLPRILKPDVPSAMGLFVSSAVIFTLLMFIGRLLTYLYVVGDFKLMDHWFDVVFQQ